MSLLKQNPIRKREINQLLKLELELNAREEKEYKVETIKYSTIYNKINKGQLPGLHHLIF